MSKEVKEVVVSYCYDPIKDIAPVDEFGFVNLREAYVNNSIPGDLSGSDADYNGVDDPESLIGRPGDVFDAVRKATFVKSAESAAKAKAAAATPQE